jgi:anti-sigma B factor antagonist
MTNGLSGDAAPLSIERVHRPPATICRLEGELDISSAPLLRAELSDLAQGTGPVVLAVEGVAFVDSTGISVLVSGYTRFKEQGLGLVLAGPQAQMRRVLEISGLDRVFTIHESEDAALEALARSESPAGR